MFTCFLCHLQWLTYKLPVMTNLTSGRTPCEVHFGHWASVKGRLKMLYVWQGWSNEHEEDWRKKKNWIFYGSDCLALSWKTTLKSKRLQRDKRATAQPGEHGFSVAWWLIDSQRQQLIENILFELSYLQKGSIMVPSSFPSTQLISSNSKCQLHRSKNVVVLTV